MSKLDKNMEEMLDIDVSTKPEGGCTTRKQQLKDVTEDREKDYEYTRGELYSLISKGQEAVQGALEVAQESGHPSCLLYTSPSPRDLSTSRMPSSA